MKASGNPIKRNIALQPLSREHHHGLLICSRISNGIRDGVLPSRIKNYTVYVWKTHLIPHFEMEEKYVFPILGKNNKLIIKALKEHQQLKILLEEDVHSLENLSQIEKNLREHIRFEERILFNEIQQIATENELEMVKKMHKILPKENWHDIFWNSPSNCKKK